MKYICRECGKEFEVKAEGKIKFVVCPSCGTDDVDYVKKEDENICQNV
jgi:predicted  nucleic acid-binding Zn-ribbon protein